MTAQLLNVTVLNNPARRRRSGVTTVRRTGRFDQQQVRLLRRMGPVPDTARHHIQLAGCERDGWRIFNVNVQLTLQHQEEVVTFRM